MGLPRRDNQRHTYGDYLTWPQGTRHELIDGVAYAMSPAPSVAHQDAVLEIARQIAEALESSPCRILVAPVDVRLPKAREADDKTDTVVQPDIVVVCDKSKIDTRGIRGAPDWIIEVLSPATASHDQIIKRKLYERHGVREYWLVHPTDKLLTTYRLEQDGSYGKPEIVELADETIVGVLPGVRIVWNRVTRWLEQ